MRDGRRPPRRPRAKVGRKMAWLQIKKKYFGAYSGIVSREAQYEAELLAGRI